MEWVMWVSSERRHGAQPPIAVKALHLLHLRCRELEVKDVAVLLDPRGSDRFGDYDDPPLDLPPYDHLRRGLGMLLGNDFDLGFLKQQGFSRLGPRPVRRSKWRKGSDGDASLLAKGEELGLPQVRMALHLICYRLHASLLQHVRDLLRVEARQPDRLGQPLLHQLLHGQPGGCWVNVTELELTILIHWIAYVPSLKSHRGVDEIKVEVVNPQVSQGLPTSRLHVLWVVLCVPKLACDEDLRSGNTRSNDACPYLCLVAIDRGTVNVAIAFSIIKSIKREKSSLV